ncbi:sugar transferase [Ruegeria sp.]|uniref:sugar transferase n=1 Tax=Ruegeria sp. TaxID=1879320 RepID=UPI003C7E6324
MPEYDIAAVSPDTAFSANRDRTPTWAFFAVKRSVDIGLSLILLPPLIGLALFLLAINPVLNRGPILFAQIRMGKEGKPFVAYKFRSMVPHKCSSRRPFDPVETCRITSLGIILRRSRVDELPQIVNVLKGEMSLIGPRPDYIHHARHYQRNIPGYRSRYRVRPGISGLAQTEVGYAQNSDTVAAKVRVDIQYINTLSLAQEFRIFCKTVQTVAGLRGQ